MIRKGISLIEILIAVAIFAVLGIIITRSIILTLQGSKKSETTVAVRENLDYAMRIIEGQIRNANSIVGCPFSNSAAINYYDQSGNLTSFSYGSSSIASGGATLTSTAVAVTNATFTCVSGTTTTQSYVDVTLAAQSATATGIQNSTETESTRIYLRNY